MSPDNVSLGGTSQGPPVSFMTHPDPTYKWGSFHQKVSLHKSMAIVCVCGGDVPLSWTPQRNRSKEFLLSSVCTRVWVGSSKKTNKQHLCTEAQLPHTPLP
ncbi:UNVERIFIED_CONTAM: hypothetical protein K2H54_047354 [Gekko kuhli]